MRYGETNTINGWKLGGETHPFSESFGDMLDM